MTEQQCGAEAIRTDDGTRVWCDMREGHARRVCAACATNMADLEQEQR